MLRCGLQATGASWREIRTARSALSGGMRMRWHAFLVSPLLLMAVAVGCANVETSGGGNSAPPTTQPGPTETVTKGPPATVTTTAPPPPLDIQPSGPAESCSFTDSRPTLSRGDTGAAVQQAQCYLNRSVTGEQRVNLPLLNGSFGPLTEGATKRFQTCVGITSDGVIGPETWAYLVYWASQPNYAC
ncbi:peptidoglycan-binding domain-containing protein [Streptomyces sioyaensis]|uniref:peptidoglycan-binding domain-containing protein n=1 Tax=Streptomyces sioyaensis TaxID=67364 RepID=UPI0033D7D469